MAIKLEYRVTSVSPVSDQGGEVRFALNESKESKELLGEGVGHALAIHFGPDEFKRWEKGDTATLTLTKSGSAADTLKNVAAAEEKAAKVRNTATK